MQILNNFLFNNLKDDEIPSLLKNKVAESFIYASKSKYFEHDSFLHVMRTLILAGADPT